ncbi:hypothetical protein BH24ACT15_BH24ACT15_06030 [soil metagenome]
MGTRRTTVTADEADLDTLEAEARRQGVSVARLMREAVRDKALGIRERRRPRLGVGRSTDGANAAEITGDPVARPPR